MGIMRSDAVDGDGLWNALQAERIREECGLDIGCRSGPLTCEDCPGFGSVAQP